MKCSFTRYRTLKCNQYRAPLQRFTSDPTDVPDCNCAKHVGCGQNCHNRLLFMECAVGHCSSLPLSKQQIYCANTVIQRSQFPRTAIFHTGRYGHGLQLLEDVEEKTVLSEYLGEVITADECKARLGTYEESDDFYFASLGGGLMLDAKSAGSTARFANHSCQPNCELQKWIVLGEPRICLVSKTALPAGTEITYNYQYFDDGLDSSFNIKRQKCHCGSPRCCGTIGGRVETSPTDLWVSRADQLLSGGKRYPLEIFVAHVESAATLSLQSDQRLMIAERLNQLTALIEESADWVKLATHIFAAETKLTANANSPLVDVDIAVALYENQPRCVKFDESARLDLLVKRTVKTQKSVTALLAKARINHDCVPSICADKFNGQKQSLAASVSSASLLSAEESAASVSVVSVEESGTSASVPQAQDECIAPTIAAEELRYSEVEAGPMLFGISGTRAANCCDVVVTVPTRPHAAIPSEPTDRIVPTGEQASHFVQCESSLQPTSVSIYSTVKSDYAQFDCAQGSINSMGKVTEKRLEEYENISTTPAQRMVWDDLMSCLRDVASCLPLQIHGTKALLQLYQQCSEWARRHLGRVWCELDGGAQSGSHTKQSDKKMAKVVKMEKLEKVAKVEIGVVIKCAKFYGLEGIVSLDLFTVAAVLDEKLSTYMERLATLQQIELGSVCHETCFPTSSQHFPPYPSGAAAAGGSGGGGAAAAACSLYCFCQLPEDDSEVAVMGECDICHGWYHPHCVNLPPGALTRKRKKSIRAPTLAVAERSHKVNMKNAAQEDAAPADQPGPVDSESHEKEDNSDDSNTALVEFICPLCLHAECVAGPFARQPLSEWRILENSTAEASAHATAATLEATRPTKAAATAKENNNTHSSNTHGNNTYGSLTVPLKQLKRSTVKNNGAVDRGQKRVKYESAMGSAQARASASGRQDRPRRGRTVSLPLSSHSSQTRGVKARNVLKKRSHQSKQKLKRILPSSCQVRSELNMNSSESSPGSAASTSKIETNNSDTSKPTNTDTPHSFQSFQLSVDTVQAVSTGSSAVPSKTLEGIVSATKQAHSVRPARPLAYLDEAKFALAMESETKLGVVGNPVALLLQLCSTYVQQWQLEINTFLSSDIARSALAQSEPPQNGSVNWWHSPCGLQAGTSTVNGPSAPLATACVSTNLNGANVDESINLNGVIAGESMKLNGANVVESTNLYGATVREVRESMNLSSVTVGESMSVNGTLVQDPIENWTKEILQECLQRYFALRVLRVRPPEVKTLRRLAWALSAGALLLPDHQKCGRWSPTTAILIESFFPLTNPFTIQISNISIRGLDLPPALGRTRNPHRCVALTELKEILQGGHLLKASNTIVFRKLLYKFQCLFSLLEDVDSSCTTLIASLSISSSYHAPSEIIVDSAATSTSTSTGCNAHVLRDMLAQVLFLEGKVVASQSQTGECPVYMWREFPCVRLLALKAWIKSQLYNYKQGQIADCREEKAWKTGGAISDGQSLSRFALAEINAEAALPVTLVDEDQLQCSSSAGFDDFSRIRVQKVETYMEISTAPVAACNEFIADYPLPSSHVASFMIEPAVISEGGCGDNMATGDRHFCQQQRHDTNISSDGRLFTSNEESLFNHVTQCKQEEVDEQNKENEEKKMQEEEEQVYCWCRRGDNGSLMVACEGCDEWFHYSCCGIQPPPKKRPQQQRATVNIVGGSPASSQRSKKQQLRRLDEDAPFKCIVCCEVGGTSYPFQWPCDLLGEQTKQLVATWSGKYEPASAASSTPAKVKPKEGKNASEEIIETVINNIGSVETTEAVVVMPEPVQVTKRDDSAEKVTIGDDPAVKIRKKRARAAVGSAFCTGRDNTSVAVQAREPKQLKFTAMSAISDFIRLHAVVVGTANDRLMLT